MIGTLVLATFYAVAYLSNWMLENINLKMVEHAKRVSEQSANKSKLLNAISVIHTTKNSNALNSALKDFNQSIKYHTAHNIGFLNKDLGRLNLSVSKFARYKAFKLYGLDLKKEALREYLLYIKKNAL